MSGEDKVAIYMQLAMFSLVGYAFTGNALGVVYGALVFIGYVILCYSIAALISYKPKDYFVIPVKKPIWRRFG